MLGIAQPKRGQNAPDIALKPSEDEITRCWGSVGAFKLVGGQRTISVGTRQLRACTGLLTTGEPYGTMLATAQVAGTNKV